LNSLFFTFRNRFLAKTESPIFPQTSKTPIIRNNEIILHIFPNMFCSLRLF
jgi:hypothetical protein